ncbi:hypothetical protein [Anaeromassilibacillus senegalensis]|uniref:hypothetical protein n=1 Tax=Anaeromassilibacillus senegalensis TaxID=1673717 RepID=UPI001A9A6C92|nr:hypothetical protein [Anaeromassilibacillus senegalensis]
MTRAELISILNTTLDATLRDCKEDNPIVFWTFFMNHFDGTVRRKIGDDLERKGKNRYTGEPAKAKQTESAVISKCDQCWCDTCKNFDDCVIDMEDCDAEVEPCPCDACVDRDCPPYSPITAEPPCGKYRAHEAGRMEHAQEKEQKQNIYQPKRSLRKLPVP